MAYFDLMSQCGYSMNLTVRYNVSFVLFHSNYTSSFPSSIDELFIFSHHWSIYSIALFFVCVVWHCYVLCCVVLRYFVHSWVCCVVLYYISFSCVPLLSCVVWCCVMWCCVVWCCVLCVLVYLFLFVVVLVFVVVFLVVLVFVVVLSLSLSDNCHPNPDPNYNPNPNLWSA